MADTIIASSAASAVVTGALKKASASTGVGFDYLYRVAVRESSLNPQAKAKTSSAAGLFQFIEQTWLGAVKKHGAAYGLQDYAKDITTGPNGKLSVADPARRREILDLRFDAEKAAALAGELARENKAALEGSLGRQVDAAELYAAHFLGAGGAKRLLSAAPSDSAAKLLPAAAKANRHVFFDGARERTVDEVMASFRRTIGAAKEAITAIGDRIEKSFAPVLRDMPFSDLREQAAAVTRRAAPRIAASTASGRAAAGPMQLETRAGALAASEAPQNALASFGFSGLSPLALAVLQALDPRELTSNNRR